MTDDQYDKLIKKLDLAIMGINALLSALKIITWVLIIQLIIGIVIAIAF